MDYRKTVNDKGRESLILWRNIALGFSGVFLFQSFLEWNSLVKVDHIESNVFAESIFLLIVNMFGPQSEAVFPLALGGFFLINALVIQVVIYRKI